MCMSHVDFAYPLPCEVCGEVKVSSGWKSYGYRALCTKCKKRETKKSKEQVIDILEYLSYKGCSELEECKECPIYLEYHKVKKEKDNLRKWSCMSLCNEIYSIKPTKKQVPIFKEVD